MQAFRSLLPYILAPLLAAQSFSGANPWFGTWKLNHEKSTMIGDTYTINRVGDAYQEDFGAVKFSFKEDGWGYPTTPGHTINVTKLRSGVWLQIKKADGKEMSRTTLKLSSGGRTLTSHITGELPNGTPFSKDVMDVRIGAGHALAGTWKTIKDSSSEPETLIYSEAGPGAMRMESVERKSVLVTHLDGKPAMEPGGLVLPDQTLAIQATSPTSYTWTLSIKGQPYVAGVNTVSSDGSFFKEVNWLIAKPAEKYTMIYERQ